MASIFNYTISGDTLNGAVAPGKLTNEINASSITIGLIGVSVSASIDDITIEFKTDISTGEETTLDALVAAHDGNPGVDDASKTSILDEDGEAVDTVLDGSVRRFAVDIGGAGVVGQKPAVSATGPFSEWLAPTGYSEVIPFPTTEFQTISGMHNPTVSDSGTATGTHSSTTIQDTSKSWTVNEFQDYIIKVLDGTGEGQWRKVVSNTSDTITVAAWNTTPDNTSTYEITELSSRLVAPETGPYHIKAKLTSSNATLHNSFSVAILVNGSFKTVSFGGDNCNTEQSYEVSKMIHLDTNDYVEIKFYNGNGAALELFGGSLRMYLQMSKV